MHSQFSFSLQTKSPSACRACRISFVSCSIPLGLQRHLMTMVSLEYPRLLCLHHQAKILHQRAMGWIGLIANSNSTSTELQTDVASFPGLRNLCGRHRLMLHSLQFLPENTEKLDLFTLPYICYWEPP